VPSKKQLVYDFAIGFCFIVFNSNGFAGDSSGIQQEKHLRLVIHHFLVSN